MHKIIYTCYHKYLYSFMSLVVILLGHSLAILGGIHFSYFDEILLWITIITICFGINYVVNLRRRHLEEQNEIHSTMLFASNHILRNLLAQIQLMRLEAMEIPEFNKKTINHFDESISEAEELLTRLSNLKSLSKKNVHISLMRPTHLTSGYKKREGRDDYIPIKLSPFKTSKIADNQLFPLTSHPTHRKSIRKVSKVFHTTIYLMVLGMLFPIASAKGQVGIGTELPNPSTVLDISASNKGVLLPRVNLLSETDIVTVTNPAHSLLVYNTNSTVDVTPGFYYWNATIPKWVRLNNSTNTLSAKFQNYDNDDDNYCGSPTDLEIFTETVWNDDPMIFVRNNNTELEVKESGKYRIVMHTYLTNSEDDENEFMAALHQVYVNGIPTGAITITGVIEDEESTHNTDGAVLIDTFELHAGDKIRVTSQAEDQSSSSEAECEFASDRTSNITITRIRSL